MKAKRPPPNRESVRAKAGKSPRVSARARYVLTPSLRRRLKKPLGRLFLATEVPGDEFLSLLAHAPFVLAVGDRVSETVQETTGRSPDMFVVDGLERRTAREIPKIAHASTIAAKNPAGGITKEALASMKRAFSGKKPSMVLIDGEEDLLTIPAIIDAPLGAVVLYGQPKVGVVAVVVDEDSKARAREVLRMMTPA